MPLNILYMTEKIQIEIFCVFYALQCPVFEVKAKINVLVPSDGKIDRLYHKTILTFSSFRHFN